MIPLLHSSKELIHIHMNDFIHLSTLMTRSPSNSPASLIESPSTLVPNTPLIIYMHDWSSRDEIQLLLKLMAKIAILR
jgi:hypothetical protein